jgi:hypothetical protein
MTRHRKTTIKGLMSTLNKLLARGLVKTTTEVWLASGEKNHGTASVATKIGARVAVYKGRKRLILSPQRKPR